MALIPCKKCGKEVSDKAKICPACGEILIQEDTQSIGTVFCEECGSEITNGETICPNCGCPITNENIEKDVPQKVEVTSVKLLKVNKKSKKKLISIIVIVIVIAIALLVGTKLNKDKKIKAFQSNLNTISLLMLTGASDAEDAGNLINQVWRNSIFEEENSKTDKYTKPKGRFVSDFNEALGNLFADKNFQETISDITSNQILVDGLMKELRDYPEGYDDAYQAVKDCYDAYLSFTNLVISPSGSLQTFSANFSNADAEMLNCYNALKLYMD